MLARYVYLAHKSLSHVSCLPCEPAAGLSCRVARQQTDLALVGSEGVSSQRGVDDVEGGPVAGMWPPAGTHHLLHLPWAPCWGAQYNLQHQHYRTLKSDEMLTLHKNIFELYPFIHITLCSHFTNINTTKLEDQSHNLDLY